MWLLWVPAVRAHLGQVIRVVAALCVAIVGLPLAARPFPITVATWLGWIGVAALAGALARRPRRVWIAWVALAVVAAVVPVNGWGLEPRRFWWLQALLAVIAVTLGFLAGTLFAGPSRPEDELRRQWSRIGTVGRRLVLGVVGIVLAALVGYAGYGFFVGGAEYAAQVPNPAPCDNPGERFGWAFEPINYDGTGEPAALDPSAAKRLCKEPRAPAGTEVVSSDGIRIAGWYVPAASGVGPTGRTVVIVHGGQANKTDGLRYAPPFHQDYNIVVIDLRNAGQSSGDQSSGGLFEQLDLRAMIDWLERTKHPTWLAVMGNSNGAATAVAEARTDDRVRALILDSMHAGIELQLGNILETEKSYPAWPAAMALIAGASSKVGGDLTTADPIRLITLLGDRPVLFTHGSVDDIDRPNESVERNLAAAIDAGIDVELHVCPGAGHGEVVDVCASQWAAWVTTFLAAHGSGV
jgi:pimeloyl-ACP methyl ester carboxylesterase